MEEDHDIPLLLGWPFLTVAGTLKDVQQGTLTLRVQGKSIEFKVFEAVKKPRDLEDFSKMSRLLWHLLAKDRTKILLDKAIVRKEFGQQPKQYMEEVAFFATSAPPQAFEKSSS
ncbi:hypothetical protein L3X38_015286 [Prunus dulcis]|uniref:Uncharacterized protein n=1 Tax=Prunus dulcis TaxID=3755 RepID=A0AAD4ZHW2_PRUDU|nr:hypothetical protein L3X38_015286 [Prunus dulcis]